MKITIRMRDNETFGVSVDPIDSFFVQLMSEAPQARKRGDEWELPVTEPNTRFLSGKVYARYNKDVELSTAARVYITKNLLESKLVGARAKRRAEYTFKDECPEITDYAFPPPPYSPYKHQVVGFDATRDEEFFALLMEMGTGKTPTMIHDICYNAIKKIGSRDKARSALPPPTDLSPEAKVERSKRIYKALIVAPKSILSNWGKEFRKHGTIPYAFGVLRGQLHERVKTISAVFSAPHRLKICAVNYEALTKMVEIIRQCMFDVIVCDESTRIKTMKAARTKAAIAIAMPYKEHQPRRRILSGQPITKNVLDLYGQFEFLRPGNNPLGFTSYNAFAKQYSTQDPVSRRVLPKDVEGLKSVVGNFSFIVKKVDCLDLPAKMYATERVEMTVEQATLYEKVENEIIQILTSEETQKEFTVTVANTLTLLLRLAQVTSGYLPADLDKEDPLAHREVKEITPNPKLERLVEVVDGLVDMNGPGQKVLIWSCFKHDIKLIEDALLKIGIPSVTFYGETSDKEREVAINLFEQNDGIRVMVGHPKSGGIGLTLCGSESCPTGTAIYYSRNYSLEDRSQSEDRAHRIGMFRPLTIIDFLSVFPEGWAQGRNETIDGRILRRLLEKKDVAEEFTDAKSVAMAMLGVGGELANV